MRILHFANRSFSSDELKSAGKSINTGVGWVATLLGRMITDTDFKFACAAFGDVRNLQASIEDRIDCFVIPRGNKESAESLGGNLQACCNLVEEWKPDLIHIHGTENNFGLLKARALVKCPVVISMQGLLGPCSQWYNYFGNSSLLDIARMHRCLEIPALRGLWTGFLRFKSMARREREIITGNKFFLGRTKWDKAYISALNPTAHYFQGGELLREAFWQKRWSIEQAKRHRVIFTNAVHPRKGTELLLNAVKVLKPHYPDIQIAIGGSISHRSGYGRYIRRQISDMGSAAIELGSLTAEQMAEELCKSHVFVSPSFIDNSPNSVCEAQLLGMPIISSYTGGVPSLIDDGRTGLFFPNGDFPMLAAKLREVFDNDDLGMLLGAQAHEVACRRHDPELVVREILSVYNNVMLNAL